MREHEAAPLPAQRPLEPPTVEARPSPSLKKYRAIVMHPEAGDVHVLLWVVAALFVLYFGIEWVDRLLGVH